MGENAVVVPGSIGVANENPPMAKPPVLTTFPVGSFSSDIGPPPTIMFAPPVGSSRMLLLGGEDLDAPQVNLLFVDWLVGPPLGCLVFGPAGPIESAVPRLFP
jgi:hypothetical protein